MTKKPVRISDVMGQQQTAAARADAALPASAEPPRTEATKKQGRTHTTLYLHSRVLREIRKIAAEYDLKPHDLLIDGVNRMLAHYGRSSIKELSEKQ